jgi:hypothetical protein
MSLSLAALTAASMAIPAFADDEPQTTTPANTTVVTAAYEEVSIAVTVPTTGTAQINPYGLPVEFKKSASSTKAAKVTGQQIVTQPLYITNEGDVALDIAASVTTEAKGDASISGKALTGKETTKSVYAYLQMVQSANKTLDDTGKDKIIDECASDSTWTAEGVTKLDLDGSKAASKEKMATLAASKVTTTDGKSTVTYNAGSIVLYRLAGDVVTKPSDDWATTDGFTATIAFTFTPAVAEE